jgi:hypothetical protein
MKSFDELFDMSDEDKLEYLHEEVEKIIDNADPKLVLKLRHVQAKIDGIRNRVKNPQVRLEMIYQEMVDSLIELADALNSTREDK